jgi:hypothetical protein
MKLLTLAALACTLGAIPAFAHTGKATSKSTKENPAKMTSETVPEGFVIVEDFVPMDLKQLPLDLVRAADSDFASKNFGEAAADLHAAARVFRLEAKQSKGDNTHLSDAADDSEKIASQVKNESIKTSEELRARLARVLYHDASHHRLQALREWNQKHYRISGADLRASSVAAEMASAWAGKDLAAATRTSIDKARSVASELTDNEGWTGPEVVSAIEGLEYAEGRIAGVVMPSSDKAKASESSPSM